MTETASSAVPSAIVITCFHVLYRSSYIRIFFDVSHVPVCPPRKYSEGVHQHNIPHRGISILFKCFLTNGKDSIVDCNHRMTIHCVWELCCRDPASSIKHLGGVQISFFSIPASSDN